MVNSAKDFELLLKTCRRKLILEAQAKGLKDLSLEIYVNINLSTLVEQELNNESQ